jgi:hypothetical protein
MQRITIFGRQERVGIQIERKCDGTRSLSLSDERAADRVRRKFLLIGQVPH